jgi:hypothetical protein
MGIKVSFQIIVRGLDDDYCNADTLLGVVFNDIESANNALQELILFEKNRRKALSFTHVDLRSDFIAANILPCMEIIGNTQIDFASNKAKPFYGMYDYRNIILHGKKIAAFWADENYYLSAFEVVLDNASKWFVRNN